MKIRIGKSAVGQLFTAQTGVVYRVLKYLPPGEKHQFRGAVSVDRGSFRGRYVVDSVVNPNRETYFHSASYLRGKKRYIRELGVTDA